MTLCKYIILLYALLILAGCANIRVDSIDPDLNIVNNTKSISTKIAFTPFEITSADQKEDIIGEAKVGLFNMPVEYDSKVKVTNILETSVKKGFGEAGFRIVASNEADFIVNGLVDKFWVSEQANGSSWEYSKASVRYDLIITNNKRDIVWANSLDTFETSDKSADTTDNNLPTLTLTLKESIEAIFKDKTFWDAISTK